MTRSTTFGLLALLVLLPATARADEVPLPRLLSPDLAAPAALPEPAAALGAPAAQGTTATPRRSGAYTRPVGPTRDQTSPFGLDVMVTFLSRDVEEVIFGERFEFNVDSTRFLLKPAIRPVPPLELYGLLGVADLQGDEAIANFDGDSGFAYGGGLRLTFFRNPEWFDTALFGEGRFLAFESEARGVAFEDPPGSGIIVFTDETFRWREWEARFGVSWRFYQARPYVGLRYSDVDADDVIEGAGSVPSVDATDNVGVFLGADLYFDPSRRAGLTLEATFPDYSSFTVGFRFWF